MCYVYFNAVKYFGIIRLKIKIFFFKYTFKFVKKIRSIYDYTHLICIKLDSSQTRLARNVLLDQFFTMLVVFITSIIISVCTKNENTC